MGLTKYFQINLDTKFKIYGLSVPICLIDFNNINFFCIYIIYRFKYLKIVIANEGTRAYLMRKVLGYRDLFLLDY